MSLYTGPFVLIILLIKRVHVLYIYTFICKGNIYCNRICKLRYLCLNLFHTVLRFVLKSLTLNFLSVVSQWTFFLLLVNENDTNGVQDTAQQDLVHSYRSSSSACLICIETIKKTDAVSTVHLMWSILNKTIFSHMTQGHYLIQFDEMEDLVFYVDLELRRLLCYVPHAVYPEVGPWRYIPACLQISRWGNP